MTHKTNFHEMLARALRLHRHDGCAQAQDMPAPFDNAGDVQIALVRYLSTGDFFQAYLRAWKPRPKRLASIFGCSTAVRTLPCRPTWSTRRLRWALMASSSSTA
jgi:hypothetical protein